MQAPGPTTPHLARTTPMPGGPASAPGADPLAELRDLHLGAPPEVLLPAPGWWLLALIAIASLLALATVIAKRWRRRRYRRGAIGMLDVMLAEFSISLDATAYLTGVSSLLKRVALVTFGRSHVAKLSGETWAAFLDETGRCRDFTMGEGQVLIDGPYQRQPSLERPEVLHSIATQWVKSHQAPSAPPSPAQAKANSQTEPRLSKADA